MSPLLRLESSRFRNIDHAEFSPSPHLNLIHGENGSGKTSLLESIHLLATGKSFRSTLVDPLIQQGAKDAVVFAQNRDGDQFGLQKFRNQKHRLRYNGVSQKNWDQVARAIPTLLIDSGTFQLLQGSSRFRRRFLDWGVFHVEHQFVEYWRRSRTALAHRNHLLKAPDWDKAQMEPWDRELSTAAEKMHQAREVYMDQLLPGFRSVFGILAEDLPGELSVTYSRGWEAGTDLLTALRRNVAQDRRYGATQLGPHRADIDFRIGGRRALELLSRGQQKLLVCALKIAQGNLFSQITGQQCVYLVDDLPAELDRKNRQRMLTQLVALDSQLFVTAVDAEALDFLAGSGAGMAMFHVEHGKITA